MVIIALIWLLNKNEVISDNTTKQLIQACVAWYVVTHLSAILKLLQLFL